MILYFVLCLYKEQPQCIVSCGVCLLIYFVVLLLQLTERNGEEHYTEEQEEQNGEEGSQEEAVVVDADSTDGAVLVNGNEADEEWGTNNEGAPSA